MTDIAWPLFGHDGAQSAFLDAYESGRLHHAWLIEGPSGIGKATLARRLAGFLLGARGPGDAPLDAGPDDPIVQKLNAEGHPDMRWIARRPDDKGKLKQDIPVDDIRSLVTFFGLRSANGGWRVGVIDAIDDLNRSGANAILKTLEEPPANCALLLVSHGSRPVLPTIRSRCRTLRLSPLSDTDVERAIGEANVEGVDPKAALSLARGRPGHGAVLASASGMAATNAARNFVRGQPSPSDAATADFIQRLGVDAVALSAGVSELMAWLAQKAESNPDVSGVWLSVSRLAAEATGLNMDRTQTAAKIAATVQAAMKSA